MGVFLLNQFSSVDHDLIVDTGQSVYDLIQHLNAGVWAFGLFRHNLENVPVEIKGIF